MPKFISFKLYQIWFPRYLGFWTSCFSTIYLRRSPSMQAHRWKKIIAFLIWIIRTSRTVSVGVIRSFWACLSVNFAWYIGPVFLQCTSCYNHPSLPHVFSPGPYDLSDLTVVFIGISKSKHLLFAWICFMQCCATLKFGEKLLWSATRRVATGSAARERTH